MTNTVQISLGKGGSIEVDIDRLHESKAVTNYIWLYGLKQMLNDVHASEKNAAAKKGLSQKKLDSLYRGEVAQARASGGDPVAREMRAMAIEDIKKQLAGLGKKFKSFSKESIEKAIAAKLEKNDASYRKAAEAKLAIKPEAVELDEELLAMLDGEPEGDESDDDTEE